MTPFRLMPRPQRISLENGAPNNAPVILTCGDLEIHVTAKPEGILIERMSERRGRDGSDYAVKVPILTLPYSADDEFVPSEQ